MIALDTNVLVRFLTQDEFHQSARANETIAALTTDAPAFVPREVVVALVWVLERSYRYPRADVADAIEGLLTTSEIKLEAPDDVGRAIAAYRHDGFGFADVMIASCAQRAGAQKLVTFDRKAARLPEAEFLGS